jgi:hypothetical protein
VGGDDPTVCSLRFTNFVENGVAVLSQRSVQLLAGALDASPSGEMQLRANKTKCNTT